MFPSWWYLLNLLSCHKTDWRITPALQHWPPIVQETLECEQERLGVSHWTGSSQHDGRFCLMARLSWLERRSLCGDYEDVPVSDTHDGLPAWKLNKLNYFFLNILFEKECQQQDWSRLQDYIESFAHSAYLEPEIPVRDHHSGQDYIHPADDVLTGDRAFTSLQLQSQNIRKMRIFLFNSLERIPVLCKYEIFFILIMKVFVCWTYIDILWEMDHIELSKRTQFNIA